MVALVVYLTCQNDAYCNSEQKHSFHC